MGNWHFLSKLLIYTLQLTNIVQTNVFVTILCSKVVCHCSTSKIKPYFCIISDYRVKCICGLSLNLELTKLISADKVRVRTEYKGRYYHPEARVRVWVRSNSVREGTPNRKLDKNLRTHVHTLQCTDTADFPF